MWLGRHAHCTYNCVGTRKSGVYKLINPDICSYACPTSMLCFKSLCNKTDVKQLARSFPYCRWGLLTSSLQSYTMHVPWERLSSTHQPSSFPQIFSTFVSSSQNEPTICHCISDRYTCVTSSQHNLSTNTH